MRWFYTASWMKTDQCDLFCCCFY